MHSTVWTSAPNFDWTLLLQDAKLPAETLAVILEAILKPLLKLFVDSVEKVRELAVELLIDFTSEISKIDSSLPYLVPAIESRMGQIEIEEPSEEVRLLQLNLCMVVITKASTLLFAVIYAHNLTYSTFQRILGRAKRWGIP